MGLSALDLALAGRILAGDEAAFEEFFAASFPGLYRFALPRVDHNADAAEEIAQATLCAALSKLSTYRGEAALFTWLCTFCRHEISAYYRRARRQPPAVELVEDNAEVAGALESLWTLRAEGPDAAVDREEVARRVHVTLDRLPPHYSDALEWKYVDGLSVLDIAGRLMLTPKAAESLLSRARAAFRDGFSALMRRTGVVAGRGGTFMNGKGA